MKIIALGDTHGRDDWKNITATYDYEKVVFIGDYFDTHENISPQQQKENFIDIIAFKKANMDKVVLLVGNHDYHYMRSVNETYSGFQEWHKTDIQELLHAALDEGLMQMCYLHDKYLFTHAGVTKTWLSSVGYNGEGIDVFINDLFKYKPLAFKFTNGVNGSPSGDDVCQTPIWVRPKSLLMDAVDGFIQVVGHTTQRRLIYVDETLILIDTLGTSGEFLGLSHKGTAISLPLKPATQTY